MKITYIGHSGFLIEWETCYWLFDYYTGNLPTFNPKKQIFIFVSHSHKDHFNSKIFDLAEKEYQIQYLLAYDIKLTPGYCKRYHIQDELKERIMSVVPYETYLLQDRNGQEIRIETLKSTDSGVAFLIRYLGKTIYHAGDLNYWVWKEETKQYNHNMTAMFLKEMELLKNVTIDVAFVPLDPRQEEDYSRGLKSLLETAKVNYVFPMHFWNKPQIISKFMEEVPSNGETQIMLVNSSGQSWNIK